METKTKIAIVGCGNISDIYLQNCLAYDLDVVACTDMDISRAEAKAGQFGVAARPLSDVLAAIRENRPHRANGEMAFHVLDLMQFFEEASISGQHIEIQSRCERPAAL